MVNKVIMKKSESGMLYPVQKEEKPKRKLGPLELKFEENRKKASLYFKELVNMENRMFLNDSCEERQELLFAVARLLLGKDWDCEILC